MIGVVVAAIALAGIVMNLAFIRVDRIFVIENLVRLSLVAVEVACIVIVTVEVK